MPGGGGGLLMGVWPAFVVADERELPEDAPKVVGRSERR